MALCSGSHNSSSTGRFAARVREHGPPTEFPWWRFSVYRDRYADKEPLYHLLLAPFTFGDLENGGKLAALVFGVLVLACVYAVALHFGIPAPAVWMVALLACGPYFLYRLLFCRPYVPGIALFLAVVYCATERKLVWLLLLTALFSLTHSTAPLALVAAIVSEICRRLTTGRGDLSVVGVVAASLALGTVMHPNLPHNVVIHYLQVWQIPKAAIVTGAVPSAGELNSPTTKALLQGIPIGILAFVAGCLIAARQNAPLRHDAYTLLWLCFVTAGMAALSQRFIELFCPVAVLFLGIVIRDAQVQGWPPRAQTVGIFVTGLLMMTGLLHSVVGAKNRVAYSPVNSYREAAAWIRANIPEGECVFTADWDDYPFLFFYDIDHTYLVGLDPMFMYAWDPQVYRTWDRLRHGRSERTFEEILEHFGTPVAVVTKDFRQLIEQARNDPRVAIPVDNEHLVVLDLRAVTPRQVRSATDQPSTATHRPSDRIASGVRHGFSREWHEWERPIRVPHR